MLNSRDRRFQIPQTLQEKLRAYRRRVWILKLLEAFAAALIGILLGFLLTYLFDRAVDTPRWVRIGLFAAAVLCCAAVPIAVERWVWRRRRMDQLAELLAQTHPSAGDQLLGVLHLSQDRSEQTRSPELVEAAIRQVAAGVVAEDLSDAVPHPRHRQRGAWALSLAAAAVLLGMLTASAAANAWARFLSPWRDTPRYTFASVQPLPSRLVVAHGEPFELAVALADGTRWRPESAKVQVEGLKASSAPLEDDRYRFDLPGQIVPIDLGVRVGDFRGRVAVEPMLRPELQSLRTTITLPEYLGRSEAIEREIRGASAAAVRGSTLTLTATASRPLASAEVNGSPRVPQGAVFSTDPITVHDTSEIELQWRDQEGLSGKEPLRITLQALDDQPPSVICENLPRRKVLLESEVLSFQVHAHDDFGVKRVGIECSSAPADEAPESMSSATTTVAETMLGAGNQTAESLELAATFCARDMGVAPGHVIVRVFVEDYYPGRERVYSPESIFEILDPSQHAIWVTAELTRWHRMSLDVRDRELQLHQTNQSLRDLSPQDLGTPDNRERLAAQAESEQDNARKLSGLVRHGEGLIREAMRNQEIAVEHLDQWAEMVQVLKDISDNRMPSVADLLKKASQAAAPSTSPSEDNAAKAGQNRLTQDAGATPQPAETQDAPPPVPTITDIESTQHDLDSVKGEQPADASAPKQARLSLPDTKLAGDAQSQPSDAAVDPQLEQAVVEQQGLLEEFQKVADDLNQVLANLEGSTLVKRLKASSRTQQQVAAGLASLVTDAFGVPDRDKSADADSFERLAQVETESSQEVSHIMDDMSAYFERSRYAHFLHVLDDMKSQDVTASLRLLSEELRQQNGLAISQAEFWSDTLDRWAEDLVEVTQASSSPGGKAKGSLPPAIVLEVLQVLEGEVNLREQTRVAEQARPAVSTTEHVETANRLAQTQQDFQSRVDKLSDRILELPNAEGDFANELNMLAEVSGVMQETTEILYKPNTGPPAIAAETEIIELLLKSKRFNPNASGGSGSDPGGGGSGKTETPALALVGAGINAQEVLEAPAAEQATGASDPGLPEEFRSGLDEYFHRLETWKSQ